MILILAAILVLIRIFYSAGEMYFERDWPRRTWRGLAISTVLLVFSISVLT
jgi:hypothetical protein